MIGGAISGGSIGLIGASVGASRWPGIIPFGALLVYLWHRRHGRVGRNAQVPRRWPKSVPAPAGYFVWGLMLGVSWLTIMPYATGAALLLTQGVSGPLLDATSGLVFAAVRSAAPAMLNRRVESSCDYKPLMQLVPAWRPIGLRLDQIGLVGMAAGVPLALLIR